MMSIGRVRSVGQLHYYARGDSGEVVEDVRWMGRGGEALGIADGTDLFEGARRTLGERGVEAFTGWDMTFSPPKSVSILWAAATDASRRAIEQAVWESVRYSIGFLEESCRLGRSGSGGAELEKAGLVVGAVMHTSNRNQEPFLHVHAIAANAAYRDSGRFTALFSRGLYQAKMACGAMFRCALAERLHALGIELREGRSRTFEVAGISDELNRRFSSRAAEIQWTVDGKPWQGSARARELAALASRKEKPAITKQQLEERWSRDLAGLGVSERIRVQELSSRKPPERQMLDLGLELGAFARLDSHAALAALERHHGHFTKFDMLRVAGTYSESHGIGPDAVRKHVDSLLASREVLAVGRVKGQDRWATRAVLRDEEKLLRRAARLARARFIEFPENSIGRPPKTIDGLSAEQQAAVRCLLRGSALQLLRGVAGSGKTRLLKALADEWKGGELTPLFFAPTHKAVLEMEASTGMRGQTVASLLYGRGADITNRTVMVVDEASMLGTRDAMKVLKRAIVAGAKLVLVGDYDQMQSVERGGAFYALWKRYSGVTLSEVHRQKEGWFRDVITNIIDDRMEVALRQLKQRGRVIEVADSQEGVAAVAATWMRERTQVLADSLVVASTRADVDDLNRAIWEARVKAGEIDPRWSVAKKGRRFTVGDRVVFTSTARDKSHVTGEYGTVRHVGLGFVGVVLDRPLKFLGVTVPLPNIVNVRPFRDAAEPIISLGYAVTTQKAQGATVERVFVLASTNQDRHATYVQMSRARADAWMVLSHHPGDRLPEMARAIGRENRKVFVKDLKLDDDPRQQLGL
jgi:conjugative relaxase-like TrwC/TraI family protein